MSVQSLGGGSVRARPIGVTDSGVALHTRDGVIAVNWIVVSKQRADHITMASNAVVLKDAAVSRLDLDGLVERLHRELPRVVPTIVSLGDEAVKKIHRHVAVDT